MIITRPSTNTYKTTILLQYEFNMNASDFSAYMHVAPCCSQTINYKSQPEFDGNRCQREDPGVHGRHIWYVHRALKRMQSNAKWMQRLTLDWANKINLLGPEPFRDSSIWGAHLGTSNPMPLCYLYLLGLQHVRVAFGSHFLHPGGAWSRCTQIKTLGPAQLGQGGSQIRARIFSARVSQSNMFLGWCSWRTSIKRTENAMAWKYSNGEQRHSEKMTAC